MAKLTKSHSNYTLRKKRQLTSKGAIYERDWMTVSEMDGFAPGTMPVYASGNFKMTVNNERDWRKKYSFSNWALTDDGDEDWTLASIKDEELKFRSELIKPNYSSILDFAYYGSAVELIHGSINDIISKYPAELYTTNKVLTYAGMDGKFHDLVNVVENPFGIDVFSPYVRADKVDNPYRYMAISWEKYEAIDDSGNTIDILGWEPGTPAKDPCFNGDYVFKDAKIIICTGSTGTNSSADCEWSDEDGRVVRRDEDGRPEVITIPIGRESINYYPAIQTVYKGIHEYNPYSSSAENKTGEVVTRDGSGNPTMIKVPVGNKNSGEPYKYYPDLQLVSIDVHEYNNREKNVLSGYLDDDVIHVPMGNSAPTYNARIQDVVSGTHEYNLTEGDPDNSELIPFMELNPLLEPVELCPKPDDDCAIIFDGVYANGNIYLVSNRPGYHIRLKKGYVDEIFESFDDFERVLLDRETKPKYKAKFHTPRETESGVVTHDVAYIWPTLSGGWNLDFLSNAYESYLEGLLYIATYYDECRSDNIWRSYTHESIKNFDWTTPRDTYVPEIDGHLIDVERMEAILKVCGRQFDDLKRYIENIRFTVNMSYDSKNNMPDRDMSRFLEMAGWEVKDVSPMSDNLTEVVEEYPGKTLKVTAEDANNEFLKRMILNSRNILSKKGTRSGIRTMYSMFGIDEYDPAGGSSNGFEIEEFDAMAGGYISEEDPDFEEVEELNKEKSSYDSQFERTGDDFCGLMTGMIERDGIRYLVPWYDIDEVYDGHPYYQMFGGWGRRYRKGVMVNVGLDKPVERTLSGGTGCSPSFAIYDETVKNVKVVENFSALNATPIGFLNEGDIYYVLNMTEAYQVFGCDDVNEDSHYVFFTGGTGEARSVRYNDDYSWFLVPSSAFTASTLEWYAKKILYLESVHDIGTGNNPHDGAGKYDIGSEYFKYYRQIFKGALDNDLFDEYRDRIQAENAKRHYENRFRDVILPDVTDGTEEAGNIGFDIPLCVDDFTVDNEKVWYFISADSGIYSRMTRNESGNYEWSNNGFAVLEKKAVAKNYFINHRSSTAKTEYEDVTKDDFPMELDVTRLDAVKADEFNSYSVVNTKNMRITYHLPREMEDYVTDVVEFYVKQLIPSTAIVEFKWKYV